MSDELKDGIKPITQEQAVKIAEWLKDVFPVLPDVLIKPYGPDLEIWLSSPEGEVAMISKARESHSVIFSDHPFESGVSRVTLFPFPATGFSAGIGNAKNDNTALKLAILKMLEEEEVKKFE